jgi:hypothetical protein
MNVRWSVRRGLLLLVAALSWTEPVSGQQQLGHKVMGGVGIDAGVQSEPGLYLLERFMWYGADRIKDRNGNTLPVPGLEIEAYANVLGFALTLKPRRWPYLSFAAGAPLAKLKINSSLPEAAIDRAGFGDLFVQPLKLGVREKHFDVVTSYTFYAPTGKFEPRGAGVGRGYWTHQVSLGGAVFLTPARLHRASILASFDFNQKKHSIDITRGNMFQLQGGAGMPLFGPFGAGVAGYALWQVSADHGDDIPPPLRGLRTRVFGLGPEINVFIPALRLRADFRFEWDFGAESRPEGRVFVGGLTQRAWAPRSRPASDGNER